MRLQQCVCGIALISIAGLFAVVARAQDEPTKKAEQPPEVVKPAAPANPVSTRGYGFMLSPDGRLRGVASTIDPNTLQLVPVANIDVVFVQNGRIISQTRSGTDGRFEADGLTPRAVYSVIAKSRSRSRGDRDRSSVGNGQPVYSAISIAVLAHQVEEAAARIKSNTQFISLIKQADGAAQVINVLQVTMIPVRDLAAVAFPQQPGGGPPPVATGGGGAGGGGSGGGGGGGGGTAAGLGAAAVAAGVAGARSGRRVASPFTP